MNRDHHTARLLLAGAAVTGALIAGPARAQDAAAIAAIQRQIQELQTQLRQLQQQSATRDAALRRAQSEVAEARAEAARANRRADGLARPAVPAASPQVADGATHAPSGQGGSSQDSPSRSGTPFPSAPAQPPSLAGSSPPAITATTVDDRPHPTFQLGGVRVTLGGFVEAVGIYRSKNLTADIASGFNAIPYAQSPNYHTSEYRQTERQSRLSLLVEGNPTARSTVSAYFEADLQGAALTANSTESNSYNPRIRQAFAEYVDQDLGLRVLGGQAWSLATQYSAGLSPRRENVPLTIDAQYVPGFTWLRVPQFRVTKSFADHYWLAASLETPEAVFSSNIASGTALPGAGATVTYTNLGGSGLSSTVNYSTDVAPDIIVKAAAEPGFGHYEAFGLGRFIRDRVSGPIPGAGSSKTAFAGGVGGSAVIPVVRGVLDLQGSVLAGYGVGRYGTGQLPDATIKADGSPAPLPEIQALVGLVAHPVPPVDVYTYIGTESIGRKFFSNGGKGYGYGSPLLVNSGCDAELSTATCSGATKQLTQGTVGGWWRFLHGNYGTLMAGAQYSFTRRDAYRGVGGAPHTSDQIVFVSLRYLPFQ